jgi:hypothetical protein
MSPAGLGGGEGLGEGGGGEGDWAGMQLAAKHNRTHTQIRLAVLW